MKYFNSFVMLIGIFVFLSFFGFVLVQGEMIEQPQINSTMDQPVSTEANLPDLVITGIKFIAPPAEGQNVSWIQINVKNQGLADAKENTLKLSSMVASCFKPDTCKPITDLIQGNIPVPAIKSGDTETLYWSPKTPPTSWIAGNYTIIGEVDTEKAVGEQNEANNTMIFATSIPTLQPSKIIEPPIQSQQ